MLNSIYIGLSGLNAHSRGLQTVSNNVTNLNTSGFKSSTVGFQNFYGNSDGGGLSFAGTSGSSGTGVGMGTSLLNMKQGELRQTDRDLDLSVDGTGFLVLMDGDELLYTRTGSFEVNQDGFIVLQGTDLRLATLDASGRPVALSIDSSRTNAPRQTTTIRFADNLSSTTTAFTVSDMQVFDPSGGVHSWDATFTRDTTAVGNRWTVTVVDETGTTIGSAPLNFDTRGQVETASRIAVLHGQCKRLHRGV